MTLLKTQAIQTALGGDWQSAVTLNQELLKSNPLDTEALNRLAFAYSVLGKIKEAKGTYQKVLAIDRLNPIALRGLKRIFSSTSSAMTDKVIPHYSISQFNSAFIEEPGKTKVVDLINIGDKKTIAQIRIGEPVALCVKRLKIFVLNEQKHYIGMLPDNIGKRLIKLLKGGNYYESYIKSFDKNRITIFIKEIKRSVRFKNQPSFSTEKVSSFILEKHSKQKTDINSDLEEESAYSSPDASETEESC